MEDPQNGAGALRGLESEFELVRELGRGGSAVVYLAIERELGREVAIKTVHPVYAADPDAAARLVREARTLARLQHPNIVTFYGVRRLADGGLAIVMQYVRGERLKDRIRSAGPLAAEEARRILADVARALVHAHRFHVVHRDIKPENIYLDSDAGLARLSDFGIARLWDQDGSLTQAGLAIGTPAYMAPEQIDGGVLDARSDIYSLGLVAHEMLSGRRPWEGQNLYGIIYRQKNEALPPIAQLRPDVPADLAAAIEIALAKQPDQRWSDARAFLTAIAGSPDPAQESDVAGASPVLPLGLDDSSEEGPVAVAWEDDAPTIPYRPADVLAAAPAPASISGAAEEPRSSAAASATGAKAPPTLLAEAERALADWEATTSEPRLRLHVGKRHVVIAAGLAVAVAGGLGAVSLLRSHNARAEKEATLDLMSSAQVAAAARGPRSIAPPPTVNLGSTRRVAERPARVRTPKPATSPRPTARKLARANAPDRKESQRVLPAPATNSALAPDTATGHHSDTLSGRIAAAVTAVPRLIGTAVGASAASRESPAQGSAEQARVPVLSSTPELREIESAPVFTPFTVAPELKNRAEVAAALSREYPRLQALGSPHGHVLIWLLLDDSGVVHRTLLRGSSGNNALDSAALRLGKLMRFSPALNRDRRVPIWVSVPVDFVNR